MAKLCDFYVLKCPVKECSKKGKLFKECGWEGSPRFRELHKVMYESSNGFSSKSWKGGSVSDVEDELRKFDRYDQFDCSFEFAVHTKSSGDGRDSKTEALFRLIRNSFAHGGFRICRYCGTRYYAFENTYKGKLKGQSSIP